MASKSTPTAAQQKQIEAHLAGDRSQGLPEGTVICFGAKEPFLVDPELAAQVPSGGTGQPTEPAANGDA